MSAALSMNYPVTSRPRAPITPFRVLIVEDERIQRVRMVEMMTATGARIFEAANGIDAIKLAVQHRPELIVIDGLLPGMSGFEVARFIRSLDGDYRPRIVMTTGIYKQTRYQNEARLKYGVDEYLVKPIDERALAAIVQSAMAARKS